MALGEGNPLVRVTAASWPTPGGMALGEGQSTGQGDPCQQANGRWILPVCPGQVTDQYITQPILCIGHPFQHWATNSLGRRHATNDELPPFFCLLPDQQVSLNSRGHPTTTE
eukprot:c22846_g1_i1 orf=997-1332(-)